MSHHRLTSFGQGMPGMRLGAYELIAPLSERKERSIWLGRPSHAPEQLVVVRFSAAASCTGSERLPYHPHFVRERARGYADGVATTVSEWVEGETLSNLFRQARRRGWSLRPQMLLPPLIQVLDALLVLQVESGLASVGVPRPQHILIDVHGEARVADGSWRRSVGTQDPAKDVIGWGKLVDALLFTPTAGARLSAPEATSQRQGDLPELSVAGVSDALQQGVLQVIGRCRADHCTRYAHLSELRMDLLDLLRFVEPQSSTHARVEDCGIPHPGEAWGRARAS